MKPLLLLAGTVIPFLLFSQAPLQKIRNYRKAHEDRIIRQEFLPFLALPNVATDKEQIRTNATALQELMRSKGIKTAELLEIESGVPPVVYGEVLVPGATKTIIFY